MATTKTKGKGSSGSSPSYKEFVQSHGGKSTARLAGAWRNRFGGDQDDTARNPGGAQDIGNPGIEAPKFDLPAALAPPVGGAPPTPPDTTGDIPTAQPPEAAQGPAVGPEVTEPALPTGPAAEPGSIASAVSDFVSGAPATEAPSPEPAIQEPGDPAGSYRPFAGSPPQVGPTTDPAQQLIEQERDPALDLILQKYKQGMG